MRNDMTLEQEKAYDEWFDGQYGVTSTRRDWFFEEIADANFNRMEAWLQAAFLVGYKAGKESQ